MKAFKTILLISFTFLIHHSFSQNIDNEIKEIRKEYKIIHENLQKYDSTTVDLEGESTEGGLLTFHTQDANIKLMTAWLYFETGKNKIEFYYKNDELFFIFNVRYKYNRPMYWDKSTAEESGDDEYFDPSKSIVIENRYYFHNSKMIRWVSPNKVIEKPINGEYSIKGKDFWTVSQYLSFSKKWSDLYPK